MSQHFGEFEILDYSEVRASTRFYFGAITPVSLPGFLVQFGALRTALSNIILGTVAREHWVGDKTELSNIPPSDPNAQRELVWHVHYVDNYAAYDHDLRIATPDLDLLIVGTDRIDFSNAAVVAFVTAFEDIVRFQRNGIEYTVEIEHITLEGHPKGWYRAK